MAGNEPIAIIGSGCRFPGGVSSPSTLWSLLKEPRDLSSEIPSDRFSVDAFYHPDSKNHGTTYVRHSYFLSEDVRQFDAPFFNISAREAESIDPQQRLLLETVYEAIERSGIRPTSLQGSSTGAFCGVMCDDYSQILARDLDRLPQYASTGIARNNISNRLSYFFDWNGPSMTIDTACSSSLVAVHLAVQALREGGCRTAVACGTNLIMSPIFYMSASRLNMLSPTGHSRMWDVHADGYARGEGVAAVVLKKLSDAIADGDHIESIIREANINQDGRTMGITMPSGTAQARLIRSTYEKAGLNLEKPEDRCQYFEAHGTGTQAGDPQEASAISQAFFPDGVRRADDHEKLLVGSVKTVIGHTEGTAGIAGLLKASLCLQHGIIVPNLHFNTLNPKVEPYYKNLLVPTRIRSWPQLPPGVPRRASVNSFGFGGTNAHVILEHYDTSPQKLFQDHIPVPAPVPLPFVFSATSDFSLGGYLSSWSQYLEVNPDADHARLAMALFGQRDTFTYKVVLYASSTSALKAEIDDEILRRKEKQALTIVRKTSSTQKAVLGIFTGQGAQWAQMGLDLILKSSQARQWIEELQAALDELPSQYRPRYMLMEELSAPAEYSRLSEAAISQPLCTALQIVQVNILHAAGITFSAVIGHSSGEIGAAYAAGLITANDAIRIAHLRGLVAKLAGADGQPGAMLAASLSVDEASSLCNQEQFRGRVSVAAFNSPQSVTLSGNGDAVKEIEALLKAEHKFARMLKVDTAYHSHHMVACSSAYLCALESADIQLQKGSQTKWFSSVHHGRQIDDSDLKSLTGSYWNDNMLKPVNFTDSLSAAMANTKPELIIEVGPHTALQGPVKQTLSDVLGSDAPEDLPYFGMLLRGRSGLQTVAETLGSLWTIVGSSFCELAPYANMLLQSPVELGDIAKEVPTYPFDHSHSYWAESRTSKAMACRPISPHLLLGKRSTEEVDGEWRWRNYLRPEDIHWLSGHQIEGQTVFPATAYVAMALEAASIMAGDKLIQLVDVCEFYVNQAIAFDDSSSIGVETIFKVENLKTTSSGICADFSCHASFSGTFRRCAHGTLEVTLGKQNQSMLPPRDTSKQYVVPTKVDKFYSYLEEIGYGYTGLFRGITEISRMKDVTTGLMANASRQDTDASALMMHPAMMDTLLQTILGSIGACDDGRLYTLLVPTKISRISVNPLFGGKSGLGDNVAFDAKLTDYSPAGIYGDAAIYDLEGNCAIQMEGVKVSPLGAPSPSNDRVLFSETVYGPLEPDASLPFVEQLPEVHLQSQLKQQLALLYMKKVSESLSADDIAGLDWHGQKVADWINHVLNLTRTGQHPVCQSEWLYSTLDEVTAKLDTSAIDVVALQIVGDYMLSFLRGDISIQQELRRQDDLLGRLYKEFTNADILGQLASVADQITFRFPRMKILEIGAGTGSATDAILEHIGRSYHSYTYTDVSPAFFDVAGEKFKDHSDRFQYKALDIEVSPVSQGFEEHSYDLIVASNVLHTTSSLQKSLAHTRSLLKPGGYLLLLEGTSPDILVGSFIFSGFPSWWVGEADGRVWGPMVNANTWDQMLKSAEFSGVDTITPHHEESLRPFSVIVSQAVDKEILQLRDPLSNEHARPSSDRSLYIIGGATDDPSRLSDSFYSTMAPYFKQVFPMKALDSPSLRHVEPMSAVLVLETDDILFNDISQQQYENLQNLVDSCSQMLWVTFGSANAEPSIGMSQGLLASAAYENPHSLYQHLNIVDFGAMNEEFITSQLLKMTVVELTNDFSFSQRVWSTENEVRYENGKMWISRLKNDGSINKRYMSDRRLVYQDVDLQTSNVSLIESGNLQIERNLSIEEAAAKANNIIRARYSTSLRFRFENAETKFLVLGIEQRTGARVMVVSETQASLLYASPRECWSVPQCIQEADEAAYLNYIASLALAETIVMRARNNSAVLFYEADDALRLAMQSAISGTLIRPIFATSKTESAILEDSSTVYIHAATSSRTIQNVLPIHDISFAYFGDETADLPSIFRRRLEALLPDDVPLENASAIAQGRESSSNSTSAIFLGKLLIEAASKFPSSVQTANIAEYQPRDSSRQLEIIDWTQKLSVQALVKPASDMVSLSASKTYLLIGMTGDLGRSVCQWMVERGARSVVLTSRNPKVEQWWIDQMMSKGVKVSVMAM